MKTGYSPRKGKQENIKEFRVLKGHLEDKYFSNFGESKTR